MGKPKGPQPPLLLGTAPAAAVSRTIISWGKELFDAVLARDDNLAEITQIVSKMRRAGQGLLLSRSVWKESDRSPLHAAAKVGHAVNIAILVGKAVGCDVNAFDVWGHPGDENRLTALHCAVFFKKEGAVRTLLDLGADPDLQERGSFMSGSPLECARRLAGADNIVRILEEAKRRRREAGKVVEEGDEGGNVVIGVLVSTVRNKRKLERDLEKGVEIQGKLEADQAKLAQLDLEKVDSDLEKVENDLEKMGNDQESRRIYQERMKIDQERAQERARIDQERAQERARIDQERERIDQERKRIDQEREKIMADMIALKGDPDFLGSDKIKRVRQDLEDVGKLKMAFEEEDPDRSCPVCFYPPKMIFACQVCPHYICGECWNKEEGKKIDRCPTCRTDFGEKPPLRSRVAERLIRGDS